MNKELNIFTLRMLREQYQAEHLDTEAEALDAAIEALEKPQQVTGKLNSDCISRQTAIDAIRNMQTYKMFEGDDTLLVDKAEVQTELMMLPSAQPDSDALDDAYAHGYTAAESEFRKRMDAQPEPQWIPCKDRLPEIAKRVLVTLSNGNVIIAQHHTVKCGSEDTWVFEPTGLQFMYDKKTVVAWMPLPECYKGEDHEDTEK